MYELTCFKPIIILILTLNLDIACFYKVKLRKCETRLKRLLGKSLSVVIEPNKNGNTANISTLDIFPLAIMSLM